MLQTNASLDLTNCDKEKIHQISAIQGHGVFIAFSQVDYKIRNISDNAQSFFELKDESSSFVGKKLSDLIPHELFTSLQTQLRGGQLKARKSHSFSCRLPRRMDGYIYQIEGDLIGLELEDNNQVLNAEEAQEKINEFLQEMQSSRTEAEIATYACRAIRYLTGFERVMIYRFFPPSMYGEVIAEDKVAAAHSFLHHRFPATDIPKPARDLYLRNQIRFIYDSAAENFDIHPKVNRDKNPLDLSDSRLRGVSKIHLEYLKNMGVRGSFSVAIIVDQKLWGIVSCHHSEPSYISHYARSQCFMVANTLALAAPILEKFTEQRGELRFHSSLHALYSELKLDSNPLDKLFRKGAVVNELFQCSGFALLSSGKTDISGLTPLSADLKRLWSWILKKCEEERKSLFYTESLSAMAPEFENIKDQVSGLMALKPSPEEDTILMFFRPEILQTVLWGGDPRKNIEARNYQGQINPRASFDTWTEVIKHSSLPWQNFEIHGIESFKDLIFDSLVTKERLISELSDRLSRKH